MTGKTLGSISPLVPERSLIPINVLMGDFPILKPHHHDEGELNLFSSRRNSWQQKLQRHIMRKADEKLVHYLISSHRS